MILFWGASPSPLFVGNSSLIRNVDVETKPLKEKRLFLSIREADRTFPTRQGWEIKDNCSGRNISFSPDNHLSALMWYDMKNEGYSAFPMPQAAKGGGIGLCGENERSAPNAP